MGASPGPRARARRRPGWLAGLSLALLVVPILEVWVILQVGRVIGGWQTLALLVGWSALGAWLVRREGVRAWRGLSTALTTGRMPSRELADAGLVLVGGALLLAPGFITDAVGLLLILPFTRPAARAVVQRLVERRLLAPAVDGLVGRASGATMWSATAGGQGAGGQDAGGQGVGGARAAGSGHAPAGGEVIEGTVIEGTVIDDGPPGGSPLTQPRPAG